MEIELDWNSKDSTWRLAVAIVTILALIGLAAIGSRVTPLTVDGSPKLLSWQDWRLFQAERAYHTELVVLQEDIAQLASMLNTRSSPVAAQILAERIAKHTKAGDISLVAAREKVMTAALNVRDWAAGTLDRDAAVQSVLDAKALLQPAGSGLSRP